MFIISIMTAYTLYFFFFFFSSRRRHTRWTGDWSSDVCSSDLGRRIPWGMRRVCGGTTDGSLTGPLTSQEVTLRAKIGRGSCRGKGEILGGGGSFKKKKKKKRGKGGGKRKER